METGNLFYKYLNLPLCDDMVIYGASHAKDVYFNAMFPVSILTIYFRLLYLIVRYIKMILSVISSI